MVRRARVGWEDERGNMLPFAVMSSLVLFAVLAFAIDQGIVYAAKVEQENALDSARAACMDASFALVAKNEDDPGRSVALEAARSVRVEGFEGRLDVWFYEAPASETIESERLWVVGMQLQEDVPTVFARGYGIDALPVASWRILTAVPYAEGAVWRPDHPGNGRYSFAPGISEAGVAFKPLDGLDEFPNEMIARIRAATVG